MAQIIWAKPAANDLEAIAEYIALDNADAASRLVKRIIGHVAKLADQPLSGSRIRELLPKSRYRQLVEPPCRIFYRYERTEDTCYILHVMRGEQLFQKRLLLGRDRPSDG
jgi:toxin ParE1/3/4